MKTLGLEKFQSLEPEERETLVRLLKIRFSTYSSLSVGMLPFIKEDDIIRAISWNSGILGPHALHRLYPDFYDRLNRLYGSGALHKEALR